MLGKFDADMVYGRPCPVADRQIFNNDTHATAQKYMPQTAAKAKSAISRRWNNPVSKMEFITISKIKDDVFKMKQKEG